MDLPAPQDEFDAQVVADIEKYGWHCILVADENHPHHAEANAALPPDPVHDAAFAYTIGLTRTWNHPEIVLVGRWQHAHAILAGVVGLIEGGQRLAPGDATDQVLDGYEVRFDRVSDERRIGLLTYAHWAYRHQPFEALQLVLPDRDGRWPDDVDYDAYPQPFLE